MRGKAVKARVVSEWYAEVMSGSRGKLMSGMASWGNQNERSKKMYAWKSGARMRVSAEVAGNVCAKLEKEGGLTAKRLVDVSRPEDAPLHGEFEWNDAEAAERFREHQARDIMSHLIIVSEDKPAEPIRAYFNISESDPKYYSASVVVSEADKYEQLKQRVIRELVAIQKRYAMVKGLNALDAVIEQIKEAS